MFNFWRLLYLISGWISFWQKGTLNDFKFGIAVANWVNVSSPISLLLSLFQNTIITIIIIIMRMRGYVKFKWTRLGRRPLTERETLHLIESFFNWGRKPPWMWAERGVSYSVCGLYLLLLIIITWNITTKQKETRKKKKRENREKKEQNMHTEKD